MTNILVVLLFVMFPPPDVVAEHPDAQPLLQAFQTEGVDDCKGKAQKLLAMVAHDFGKDTSASATCLAFPAPEPAPKKTI